MILDRVIQHLIGWADWLADGPTGLTGFQTLDSFEEVDRVCDRKDDLYFLN
jgi:hypothetical protein